MKDLEGKPVESELTGYDAKAFHGVDPKSDCDLIMKGGITSGVVYPYAITEIAKKYHFRAIGGTSAGAIAAAFASAAEYARAWTDPKDPEEGTAATGFHRLNKKSLELPKILLSLFHPQDSFSGIFKRALQFSDEKSWPRRLIKNWKRYVSIAAASIFIIALALFENTEIDSKLLQVNLLHAVVIVFAIVGLICAGVLFYGYRISRILKLIPRQGFGLCTGKTNPKFSKTDGLTDWLHKAIQQIAFGEQGNPRPLTFGDLEKEDKDGNKIELRMITTNLSMRRPHMLPDLHIFSEEDVSEDCEQEPANSRHQHKIKMGFSRTEWARLFSDDVMDYLCPLRGQDETQVGELPKNPENGYEPEILDKNNGVWALPAPEHLPVIIAVRMSLSFPVLFTAVPMWVKDHASCKVCKTLTKGEQTFEPTWQRVWFSDGGISSNFPIHMFDSFLPGRPTFALSLDELPKKLEDDAPANRVVIPETSSKHAGLPMVRIKSLGDFVWNILNSAKDWQDQLLAGMPGQRERIARIYLSSKEGGLNLAMPEEVSTQLMLYGQQVGQAFSEGAMDFEAHRLNRALVAYEQLQDTIIRTEKRWRDADYSKLMDEQESQVSRENLDTVKGRFIQFGMLVNHFEPQIDIVDAKFPRPNGKLRISPVE